MEVRTRHARSHRHRLAAGRAEGDRVLKPEGRHGFTLIELLVVISIIALLIGILMPVLGKARKSARAVNSLANTRSWAQGTHMYLMDSNGMLPWEGLKQEINDTLVEPLWWANVVPPYVNQPSYYDLRYQRLSTGRPIPLPPDSNIFVDPAAEIGPGVLADIGVPNAESLKFYFSYVPNANLTNSVKLFKPYPGDPNPVKKDIELVDFDHNIRRPSATALMFELRAARAEMDGIGGTAANNERLEKDLIRLKGDFKHFAGRHFHGGHIAFGDGHAAHYRWEDVNLDEPIYWRLDQPGPHN